MWPYILLPYLLILRVEICAGTFVLVILSTWIASPQEFPLVSALIGAIGVALSAGAGSVINDAFDWNKDKVNNPHRMIPDRLLEREDALKYYVALVLLSLLSLWFVNVPVFLVGIWCWVSLFFYSWKLREINGLLSNAVVAMNVGLALALGAFITGQYTPMMAFLFAYGFCVALAREILGDVTDIKGDALGGKLKTIPIVSGVPQALTIALILLLWIGTFSVTPLASSTMFRHPLFGAMVSMACAVGMTSFSFRWVTGERVRHAQNFLKYGALFGYPLTIGIDRSLPW